MKEHLLPQIGKKIRSIRKSNGQTIQEVANKAEVSKGLISKIENSHTVPSLPVLLNLIHALDTTVPLFFEDIEYISYENLVHKSKDEYVLVEKENGSAYHAILNQHFPNFGLEVNILDVLPDNAKELSPRKGFTYLYMLRGEVEYVLGEHVFSLREEDSMFLNGKFIQKPVNRSEEKASILLVHLLTEPKG